MRHSKKINIASPVIEFEVDHLESRQMLAGSITTAVTGGSLLISGDGQDNAVALAQVDDALVVVGIDTTIADADETINVLGIGVDIKVIGNVTKDVNVILRGGDDIFVSGLSATTEVDQLFEGGEGGGLGASFASLLLPRDLNIYMNGGRDAVIVSGTEVGRDLFIDTGFGLEDYVLIGGGGIATALADAVDSIDIDFGPITVALDSVATTLDGGYEAYIDDALDAAAAFLGDVSVGRDLRIRGESSDDYQYIGGLNVGRDVIITTNTGEDNIHFGTGVNLSVYVYEYDWFAGLLPTELDVDLGDLSWYDVTNYLEYEVGLNSYVTVGRNAYINTGDGDDLTWIGGYLDVYLEIGYYDGGDGEPGLEQGSSFYQYSWSGGVSVNNNFTIDNLSHDDTTYIAVGERYYYQNGEDIIPDFVESDSESESHVNVWVGRDMRVLTGADDDFLQIGGDLNLIAVSPALQAPFSEMNGYGAAALEVDRNLIIDTSAGTDEVILGQQIPIWIYVNGVRPSYDEISVGRDLVINTGWHDDILTVASFPYFYNYEGGGVGALSSVGSLNVGRDMKINTDGGNDQINLAFQETGDGPRGGVDETAWAINIGRDLKVTTGDQDDNLMIDYTNVGDDVVISTGWGRDTTQIGQFGFHGGNQLAAISPDSYSVWIGDQLRFVTDLERDVIEIIYTHVGGKSFFNTGLRDDTIIIDSSSFGGQMNINTGLGNDMVEIINSNVSKLKAIMADGDDWVCLCGTTFDSDPVLNGGKGENDELYWDLGLDDPPGFEFVGTCGKVVI